MMGGNASVVHVGKFTVNPPEDLPNVNVAIIGSTSHWSNFTRVFCNVLVWHLRGVTNVTFMTGGEAGGPPSTFVHALRPLKNKSVSIKFIVPEQAFPNWKWDDSIDGVAYPDAEPDETLPWEDYELDVMDGAETVTMGRTDKDRQKELAQHADIFLMIEGGPGAANEARNALKLRKPVFVVRGSSPRADEIFNEVGIDYTNTDLPFLILDAIDRKRHQKT